jgi:pimeloyl-ACP methyl ester carboxylesterase
LTLRFASTVLLILPVLLFVDGCALPEKRVSSPVPIVTGECYLKESRRRNLSKDKRLGFLLAAARISSNELEKGEARARARQLYNASTAEFAVLLNASPNRWNVTTTVEGPDAIYRVSFAPGNRNQAIWDPALFSEILAPSALKEKSLLTISNCEGFGGSVVGVHKPEDPRKWFLPKMGVSAPVTAVADFERTASRGIVNVTLALYDPTKRDRVFLAREERPLSANFGAPLAYYPDPWLLEYAALLNPMHYGEREGLYFVQPYDPEKIPVVLVHGLMSIPQMWFPIIAQIERDAELRGKFQFWLFGYPTGDPVALLALRLRESLRRVYEVYPKAKNMVMVSYSLGGLLGQMQVQTTGYAAWRGVFKGEAGRLQAKLPPDSLLKRALLFEANPRITRIVFICTPHLGSPLAAGLLGRFGRSIILLPARVLEGAGNLALKSLAAAVGQKGHFVPNSVWGMSPKSPLLLSLHPLPIKPPFHSIIGNQGLDKIPLKDSSDGVVPYWSSHLAGAVSERIVPAQHVTACQNPETVEELKRILRLHLSAISNHN